MRERHKGGKAAISLLSIVLEKKKSTCLCGVVCRNERVALMRLRLPPVAHTYQEGNQVKACIKSNNNEYVRCMSMPKTRRHKHITNTIVLNLHSPKQRGRRNAHSHTAHTRTCRPPHTTNKWAHKRKKNAKDTRQNCIRSNLAVRTCRGWLSRPSSHGRPIRPRRRNTEISLNRGTA